MATTPHEEQRSYTASGAADLGVELLPLREESPAEYLARLKAIHQRVGSLIDTIEKRRPVLGPVPVRPPRAVADRRAEVGERRAGISDRRHGEPDPRPVPIERRFGKRDRRTGAAVIDRRDVYDRRRDPPAVPWQRSGGLRWDRTTMVWAIQIVAWITIAVVALVFGLGH